MCSAHAVKKKATQDELKPGLPQCDKADALPSIWGKTLDYFVPRWSEKWTERDKELVYESASSISPIHLQLKWAHIESCLAVK